MTENENLAPYLRPSRFIDCDQPDITSLAADVAGTEGSALEKAVRLYYWVRYERRYNPYILDPDPNSFLASTTLAAGEGWCVTKAILLAALCRATGLPARVGYADVRNHLSTERLRQAMQTDVFYFHGYTAIFLEGQWVKATPAFNLSLCEKFDLQPLEFNGREDSIYHAFDNAGNRHMEYLNDRGQFLELPFEKMMRVFHEHYPAMMAQFSTATQGKDETSRWEREVMEETAR